MDTDHTTKGENLARLISPFARRKAVNEWLPILPGIAEERPSEYVKNNSISEYTREE